MKNTSRRGLLKILVAAGIPAPVALNLLAQSRSKLSTDVVKQASVVIGQDYSEERLRVIEAALQRNLDQYQSLRGFEIGDSVEPAPIFVPTRHAAK